MLCPLEKPHPETLALAQDCLKVIADMDMRLPASPLLKVFRSESRDEILLRGEGCNTPGVYIPLDNEYGFKHVISVDKTDAKF
jgi:hypothetical protein